MSMFQRFSTQVPTVTLNTATSTTEELRLGSYAGGFLFIPADSTITSLTWYVAEKPGGTYLAANDEDSHPITQTVTAGQAYAIPAALFGAIVAKAVSDAEDDVDICLKA